MAGIILGEYFCTNCLLGAVPLLSVLHALDPRLLPIVYDMPQCNSIMSESILTCLTLGNRLGRLRQGTLGIRALKNVVGVQCDG